LGQKRRNTRSRLRTQLEMAGFAVRFISYTNLIILSVAVVVRIVKSVLGGGAVGPYKSEFIRVPSLIHAGLLGIGRAESFWMRHATLPCGLSILGLAEKTG